MISIAGRDFEAMAVNMEAGSEANNKLDATEVPVCEDKPDEHIDFTVVFNKEKIKINFPCNSTIASLKEHLQTLTGVPATMQKMVFKGIYSQEGMLS